MRVRALSLSLAAGLLALTLVWVWTVSAGPAGSPEPAGPPDATASYSLEDLYQRLDRGAAGTPISFTEPILGPGTGTMHSTDEIMAIAPALDEADGAVATEVLSGTTCWGLTSAQWGRMTGTMANHGGVVVIPEAVSQTLAAGYHDGSGYVEGDADLVPTHIASGVDLFGVAGALHGGCTCAGTLDGTRWCDNGDGTVTDLTTCLVWLQKADWGGGHPLWAATVTGMNAHDRAAQLWDGSPWEGNAGLSDGSVQGDWRLPTKTELEWLANGPEPVRDVTPRAFTGVKMSSYWTSMFAPEYPSNAWIVALYNGSGRWSYKTSSWWVWPLRGGQ
jgi:hypothetical protein